MNPNEIQGAKRILGELCQRFSGGDVSLWFIDCEHESEEMSQ